MSYPLPEGAAGLNRFITEQVSSLRPESSIAERLTVAAGLTHLLIGQVEGRPYTEDALLALFDIAATLGGVPGNAGQVAFLEQGANLAAEYENQ